MAQSAVTPANTAIIPTTRTPLLTACLLLARLRCAAMRGLLQYLDDGVAVVGLRDAECGSPVLAARTHIGARLQQQLDDARAIAAGRDHQRGDAAGIRGVHFGAMLDQGS